MKTTTKVSNHWTTAQSIEALASNELFAGSEASELRAIAEHAVLQRLDEGQVLFVEGEYPLGLYVLVSGSTRSVRESSNGDEQILSVERPVDTLGEVAMFDGGCCYATTVAQQRSEVLFIDRQSFKRICSERPAMFGRALRVMSSRVRQYADLIEALSLNKVERRVAWFVLREATRRGIATDAGLSFELTMTHQQIASHLGTVREMVTRSLGHLQREHMIEIHGRLAVILDQQSLLEYVAS